MSVDTFLSRLCALVPPPRFHMTRYCGVLTSHHRLRARVIPSSPQPPAPTQLSQLFLVFALGLLDEFREATSTPRRYGWASLLARAFAVDVTVCSKCGGKMRILEVVTDPERSFRTSGAKSSVSRGSPPSRRSTAASSRRGGPMGRGICPSCMGRRMAEGANQTRAP